MSKKVAFGHFSSIYDVVAHDENRELVIVRSSLTDKYVRQVHDLAKTALQSKIIEEPPHGPQFDYLVHHIHFVISTSVVAIDGQEFHLCHAKATTRYSDPSIPIYERPVKDCQVKVSFCSPVPSSI